MGARADRGADRGGPGLPHGARSRRLLQVCAALRAAVPQVFICFTLADLAAVEVSGATVQYLKGQRFKVTSLEKSCPWTQHPGLRVRNSCQVVTRPCMLKKCGGSLRHSTLASSCDTLQLGGRADVSLPVMSSTAQHSSVQGRQHCVGLLTEANPDSSRRAKVPCLVAQPSEKERARSL